MAITSGFFNSLNNDRLYTAEQMSEYYAGLLSDGVVQNYRGGLQVLASATPDMNVNVQSGRAYIDGRWMDVDAVEPLAITAAHVTLNRYTAVCVHLDLSSREMTLETIDGTAATSPTRPTPTASASDLYLVLAYVYVAAGATSITAANISDQRANTEICGYVNGLVDQVDTTTLFLQWQAAYETFFADLEAWEANMRSQFDAWFDALTDELNVNTYIEDYSKTVTLSTGSMTQITLDMTGYTYDASDIIQVHVNGLLGVEGTDYTLDTSGTTPTVAPAATAVGTEVVITVYKSRIGFSS